MELNREVRAALAGAYGAAVGASARKRVVRKRPVGERLVGTEHLLVGVVAGTDTGPTAQALAAARLTTPVVLAALRRHDDRWQHDDRDDGEWPLGVLDRYPARKPMAYTGAARAALHRAAAIAAEQGGAELDNGHLLSGLLEGGENRATELLRACGLDPARLRDQAPEEDPVAPELRPTRDALLGIGSVRVRLFASYLAELPAMWAILDARGQARRLGAHGAGTEHLVLAILAIHETMQRYPHLQPDHAEARYAGGRVLATAGLTYLAARDAVQHHAGELGTDARRLSFYTRRLGRYGASMGTGHLLLEVLTQDDSRGTNLVRSLGVPPQRVRARLRTA